MRKMVRRIIGVAILATLCLPFQANAASLTDWENLGLPGLTLDPMDSDALFFQWTAVTSNNTSLHDDLDFGLVMYEDNSLVKFAFVNFDSAAFSSITDIYFDDSGANGYLAPLLNSNIVESPSGPQFTVDPNPNDPPGYANFTADQALSADSDSPVSPNGVESRPEWVVLGYGYGTNRSYDDIYLAVLEGDIRIAMHVQSISATGSGGGSDVFAWTPVEGYYPPRDPDPPVVPVPAAAGLGFVGMALVGVMHCKKK